jgi:hypothetical protein
MNSHLNFFGATRRVALMRTDLRFLILPLLRDQINSELKSLPFTCYSIRTDSQTFVSFITGGDDAISI